ncbi:DNA double-strand break repair nuclease NurA [Tardisphaera miroshnichenkoae]
MSEDQVEWLKLPPDLQYKLMEVAEEEAQRVKENHKKLITILEELKKLALPHVKRLPEEEKEPLVAAVDGSRSPMLSRRLGASYGAFTASGLAIRGSREVWEDHLAGQFKRNGALSQERSMYSFELISLLAERKMALEALDHADHVIVDGSFYGYAYTANKRIEMGELSENDVKIIGEINELTEKIVKSGRAFAVIKRTRSRVLEGYAYLSGLEEDLTGITDKLSLSYAMPGRSYIAYSELTGGRHPMELTIFAQRKEMEEREGGTGEGAPDWGDIEERVYGPPQRIGIPVEDLSSLERIQVKAYEDAPACEVELPKGKEEEVISVLSAPDFFNRDTGLPMVLDMVDQLTTLGVRFAEEYVDEVEARALQLVIEESGPSAIKWFFRPLNPQKPY